MASQLRRMPQNAFAAGMATQLQATELITSRDLETEVASANCSASQKEKAKPQALKQETEWRLS